jgi:hypothetical protein
MPCSKTSTHAGISVGTLNSLKREFRAFRTYVPTHRIEDIIIPRFEVRQVVYVVIEEATTFVQYTQYLRESS